MDEVNITIIGAGLIGLAIAAELSKNHKDVIVVEKWDSFGRETSSRNSEVIHSGIYYPTGSLKAKLCLEGAPLLYDLCSKNNIPFKRLGKLIVATNSDELNKIDALYDTGKANGLTELRIIDADEIHRLEPAVKGVAAIHLPQTGIVDSHALMEHFHSYAEHRGVLFSFNTEIKTIEPQGTGFVISIKQDDYTFKSNCVINCAGLYSDIIAEMAGIDINKHNLKIKKCKGSYFRYAKKSPVNMLVYPVPHEELAGLGVHGTLDMGNSLRFGPDVEYVDTIDYFVDSTKHEAFYHAACNIIPDLEKSALSPDMAGIRPKLSAPEEKVRDFVIENSLLSGLINLIGIESPGLTSCIAISKYVAQFLSKT